MALLNHRNKVQKAKIFYGRQGYKIEIPPSTDVWDFFAIGKFDTVYVQVFATKKRLQEVENIKNLPARVHVEVVYYSKEQRRDLPSNRIIYPSPYKL